MNTDFFDLCGQIYADFSTPLSPSCEEGSLSHSQALALSIRARDVAGGAIALPEFWSASGACAFVLKSSFNSLYDPFGSPCRGQKPSLPLKKAPPLISVFSPQGRRGKPPYSVLEPLRYKVGGPKRSRQVMRDGTARDGKAICKYLNFLIWIEVLKETGSSLL